MHIKSIKCQNFKRFTDLTIEELPVSAKLVLLLGPNGVGKSSLFDAFRVWQVYHSGPGLNHDPTYYNKAIAADYSQSVAIEFHEADSQQNWNKSFYIRSAYRNDPDFNASSIARLNSPLETPSVSRLIDTNPKVSENFQRVLSLTISEMFLRSNSERPVKDVLEKLFGVLGKSLSRIFDDLVMPTLEDPTSHGTFTFDKGLTRGFPYKNLSAGEKGAFDLILDFVVKRESFNNTVFCVDEPDLHMHTKLQGLLLEELLKLLPDNCQLWIATHSIGMINRARKLASEMPGQVVFVDFGNRNFDDKVTLTPVPVSRDYWTSVLRTALAELADLVAPSTIVLCEGRPLGPQNTRKSGFDAKCFRMIFNSTRPDTDFLSVGNANDVESDRIELGHSFQAIVPGTKVIRVIDRDDRNENEIAALTKEGVRVLSRRQIESYLLADEILTKYCESVGKPEKTIEVLDAKKRAAEEMERQDKPRDDIKSAAGLIYNAMRSALGLLGRGQDVGAFLLSDLAPLVTPETETFEALQRDIFGP